MPMKTIAQGETTTSVEATIRELCDVFKLTADNSGSIVDEIGTEIGQILFSADGRTWSIIMYE